jgi:hypothetical protein
MASLSNPNAAVRAKNGLGSTTHIVTINTATATVEEACIEAQNEGFTVAAVEGTADGSAIALQGTGTPSITGGTLVATFS